MLGYESGELIGQSTRVLFADDGSYDTFLNEIKAALKEKSVYTGIHTRKRKDGTVGWYQINIDRPASQPEIFFGSFIDETLRHKTQLELEAHRTVVEDQTELISRYLPDKTFSFVNDVFCRFFGKPRDELMGYHWAPLAHPDDMPAIEKKLAELNPINPIVIIENRVANTSGEWRWFQFSNRAMFDADGHLQEIQSVGRDITELKRTEHQLQENQERLEQALLGSGMVLWDWDISQHQVTSGHRWFETLGYTSDELGVSEDDWMGLIHPGDLNSFSQKITAHLEGNTPRFESEHRLKHKDGHWVSVLAYGKVSLRDKDGKPVRMIGTVQDVSQRKRLNEEGVTLLKRVEALIRESAPISNEESGALVSLTKREVQILGLIGEGMTSAQIAKKLGVATNTVISHRQKLMAKLDLHSTAEAVRFALDNAIPGKSRPGN